MSDDEGKLHDGYHGWFKTVARTGQDFTPKPLTGPLQESTNGTGSAWNKGGTEEIDKSEWAREALKQHVLESFKFTDNVHKITIVATEIITCTGETKRNGSIVK
ncbi:hypothetical protein THRCLA_22849 [Thraustotheca clavata]|uniref:Uncharacterized protein n=1 Tax=Thraustotheca clavata TaxID=74557 RepID=A0A1V9YSB8_9STRA|nr:hypothetical protein THRCLA_22849 [Thraustotheca clavata]